MTADPHHGFGGEGERGEAPHGPAPEPPPFNFWKNPLLPQGVGLGGIALVALWLLAKAWRASRLLGVVALPVLSIVALFATWASAIHLTGGEKFDDHPWV